MYRHRQIGWLMILILGTALVIFGLTAVRASHALYYFILATLLFCLVFFTTLSVAVTDEIVHVKFGPGIIGKRIRLDEVLYCNPVRNRWQYGWGIRKIPQGWLFNVSGLDAVEMVMKDGRIYRIGTDEPDKLSRAIDERIPGNGKSY
jgi:hypothetical protein